MNIRQVVAADARGVATVHVHTWQAAYRGIVPDAYLDTLSIDKREHIWRESIRRGTPETWVAESSSQVIGWTAFGASRDPGARAQIGELEAIYLLPLYWGTGTGRALWLQTRRRLIDRGFQGATLWVLSDNARAIRFYAAGGFIPDPSTEKELSIAGRTLKEIRYATIFGDAAATGST
jgi:GNAT superfamily N-acetyltransferase